MTEKKSYISTLSYSNYGYSPGSGSGYISLHANGVSSNITLDKEEVAMLEALAWKIFQKRKHAMLEQLHNMEQPALLEYDLGKSVIEGESKRSVTLDDDIPF